MCLSIEVKFPDRVLSKGEHEGFEWVTVHNDGGYRCGYVRIPEGHPWHGKSYDEIEPNPEIHGGLTFAEADKECEKDEPDNAWWIGFDCAHAWDAIDPSLPMRPDLNRHISSEMYKSLFRASAESTIKDQAYVESECKSLCRQAKEETNEVRSHQI